MVDFYFEKLHFENSLFPDQSVLYIILYWSLIYERLKVRLVYKLKSYVKSFLKSCLWQTWSIKFLVMVRMGVVVLKMMLIHLLGIISVLKDVMSSGLKLLEICSYAKTSDKEIRTRGKLKNYYSLTALQVLFSLYIYIHMHVCT